MSLNLTLLLQIISFLILMGLLAKFLYKPILDMLERRSREIAQDIDSAKHSQEEAQRYAQETHKALNMAKDEAIKMKEQAQRDADSARRDLLTEAKKEYAEVLNRAKIETGKQIDEAKAGLKKQIAILSTEIAKKILQKEIKETDHDKLIDKATEEIDNG